MQQSQKNIKTTSRYQNTVEYIAGKSFLFISLKENLDLILFSFCRSHAVFYLSYKVSCFQRSPVTRQRCLKGHGSPMVCTFPVGNLGPPVLTQALKNKCYYSNCSDPGMLSFVRSRWFCKLSYSRTSRKRPLKLDLVVAYKNRATGRLYREEVWACAHLPILMEDNLLHAISKLRHAQFHVVTNVLRT